MAKQISILGSTGSIGVNALKVASHLKDELDIVYLTANKNAALLIEQVNQFQPKGVCIVDETAFLKVYLGTGSSVSAGDLVFNSGEVNLVDYDGINKTRALEISINEENHTADIVWEYILDPYLFGELSGNVQKLNNAGKELVKAEKFYYWGFFLSAIFPAIIVPSTKRSPSRKSTGVTHVGVPLTFLSIPCSLPLS
jgi:hypothetical protein